MITWYALAFISAVLFAVGVLARKKVLFKEHATEYLTSLFVLASLMVVPFIGEVDFSLSLSTFGLIYLKVFVFTIAVILSAKSARHMEVSHHQPLANLTVLFAILLSFFLLGDVLSFKQGVGVLFILVGTYTLEVSRKSNYLPSFGKKKRYILMYVFATLIFAVAAILDKEILQHTNTVTLLVLPIWILAIHFIFIQFFRYKGFKDIKHSFKEGGFWIVLVALMFIFSELTYLKAVSIPIALISLILVIRRTSSFISTLIGGELFHEHHLVRKIISVIIMLMGVYLTVA